MTKAATPRLHTGALAAMLCLAGCGPERMPVPARPARPIRVMSLNQCADQLVLALLPPSRIASVTWLSRDPAGSLMSAAAMKVRTNHGLVEEVIREQPDLVIANSFSTPTVRAMLKRLGYPMIEVDNADSFEQIRAITRQVAAAVGEPAKGEALISRMDGRLASLAQDKTTRLRIAAWDAGGFNAARGTLYDAILTAAGADNIANDQPIASIGAPDVERLVATAPELIVTSPPHASRAGLDDNLYRHPLIRRYWGKDRTLTISQASYICGTPMVANAVISLRDQLHRAAAAARTPLPFASKVAR